jgi:lysophospholipase L1-like esterase
MIIVILVKNNNPLSQLTMTTQKSKKDDSHNINDTISRRKFFLNSGTAILATTFLSACNVFEDIFPGKSDRDKTLAFFGDSLTIGAGGTAPYGNVVGEAFSNRRVLSDGIVGQVASRIAVRQGGVPLKISIEGNKLDSIKPVKITKLSNPFLSTPTNGNEYSKIGSVNGVRCTIRRTANGEQDNYTIAPATVSMIDIPENSTFIIEEAENLRSATQILWYGRNDIGKSNAETEILSALESSVAYITAPARYIVLGVLISAVENKGTANFNQVKAINEKLATRFGNQFVEMTPPTEAEMAAINYIPTNDDKADLVNLNFPRGMRADVNTDDIHLNDKGYKIVANRVISKLKELKY